MTSSRKTWAIFFAVVLGTFTLLGFFGVEIYRQAPPIPTAIVADDGTTFATEDDILTGQQVWQSMGGMQVGSIWGHGAYQAPDWSADWLHRECVALLELWAQREHGSSYDELPPEVQAGLRARLKDQLRTNTYDPESGEVTISSDRLAAMRSVASHYDDLFGGADGMAQLREDYALAKTSVPDPERRRQMTIFFAWTAWACGTQRPGAHITYTNNWPHEPLIDNRPSGANVLWSWISVVLLLAAIGLIVWRRAFHGGEEEEHGGPDRDPLALTTITPSMKAVGKYVAVVVVLFLVQVLLGAITAHYTVEGQHFFGFPLAEYLPYSLTRTWHIQTAVFWIATAFLAAGLFIGPIVGGREPKYQRLGVNVLFGALLVVVGGSLAGEWFAIHQKLSLEASFWFGHQGYEYVDLGRFWQVALFIGLVLWLTLMLRALAPALRSKDANGGDRNLLWLFTGASGAIGLMYAAGFFFSARTHLSVMEYWRWWIVHLWVEGFFEVFATAAVSFIFARMGLIRAKTAGTAVIAASSLFLLGGIPGTFHHLYFSGTPTPVLAVGATFSALEVVPLVLVGFEAYRTWKLQHATDWMQRYAWPIRFFVGVAFWNLVGAGLFGFLINPPLSLYYLQGLNTTPVHGHTALFGVYGLLSLGLMLLVARVLTRQREWATAPLAWAFWSMNIGLSLMVVLSLLPIGLAQAWASVETGLWYARSSEFLQLPVMEVLRWLRIVGDVIFLAGVGLFAWWMLGLKFGWSYRGSRTEAFAQDDALTGSAS